MKKKNINLLHGYMKLNSIIWQFSSRSDDLHVPVTKKYSSLQCWFLHHMTVRHLERDLYERSGFYIRGPGTTVYLTVRLVFSVTPFKLDQNKNQNRPIDKVQNLGNERRYIYKDPRQNSGQRNISYTRYPNKCFTQIYRDLYGDAMLVLTWFPSAMLELIQQKHLLPSFATKA